MNRLVLSLLALLLGLTAAPAVAQVAGGSITIERALTVTSARPMAFGLSDEGVDAVASGEVSEAIIEVTGDPGRVYRIHLPDSVAAGPDGAVVEDFTLRSENSGDISHTLIARMDVRGFDRLYVGGRLRHSGGLSFTDINAAIPLTIDYE